MAGFDALIDLTIDSESKQVVAETPPNQKETTKLRDPHQSTKSTPRLTSASATPSHSQRPLGSSHRLSIESKSSSGFSKQATRVFTKPQTLASLDLGTSRVIDTSGGDVRVIDRPILPGPRRMSTKSFVDLTRDDGGNKAQSQPAKQQFTVQPKLPEEIRRSILNDSEEDIQFRFPPLIPSFAAERNQDQLSDRGKSVSAPISSPSFKIPEAAISRMSPAPNLDLEAPATPGMETTADWAVLRSSAQKSATEAATSDRMHWDAVASTTGRTAAEAIPDSARPKSAILDLSGVAAGSHGAAKQVEFASKEHHKPQQLSNASNEYDIEFRDESQDRSEYEANQFTGNGSGDVISEASPVLFTLSGADEKVNRRKSIMKPNTPSRKFPVRQEASSRHIHYEYSF